MQEDRYPFLTMLMQWLSGFALLFWISTILYLTPLLFF